ncbi:MAG TPA: DUF3137 domain-containing protein [Bacteroidales bacterium]|nr:DUF3137 domain-containing protein [Bacteroidales bacterium]
MSYPSCLNCNFNITNDSNFCPKCGAPLLKSRLSTKEVLDDLKFYFEKEIKPGLVELEKWRKKALRRAIITDVLLGPPFVFAIIYCTIYLIRYAIEKQMTIANLILAAFVVLPILYLFFSLYHILWQTIRYTRWVKKSRGEKTYSQSIINEKLFKDLVIGKLVKFISPDLSFNPEVKQIRGEEILKSEIFPHTIFYPHGYGAEDFVEGKIGDTHIRFFEISGKNAIVPYDSKGSIDYTRFAYERFSFFGMFGIVDFNKSFKGHTVVLPETRLRESQWMRGSGREIVKLEDPEFEKHFSVYSTDQIAARYILSTSLMKRITDFRKKIDRRFYLSFTENRFYVAISHKKDQFELNMYKSLYNFDRVKGFFNDLTIITDIVEDLNLNTRIWMKEDEKVSKMFEISPEYNFRKKWVFRLLTFLFGYLGLHYLYIGFKGKALTNLLVTAAVFPYLILRTIQNNGNGASGFLLIILAIIWFIRIILKSYWITSDSRGVPMD